MPWIRVLFVCNKNAPRYYPRGLRTKIYPSYGRLTVAIQLLVIAMSLELVFYKIDTEIMRDGVALLVLVRLALIGDEVRTEVVRDGMTLVVSVYRAFVGDKLLVIKARLVWCYILHSFFSFLCKKIETIGLLVTVY